MYSEKIATDCSKTVDSSLYNSNCYQIACQQSCARKLRESLFWLTVWREDINYTVRGTDWEYQLLPPGQEEVVGALSLSQCSASWCFILFIWTPPVMVLLVLGPLLMLAQHRGQSLQTHITWPEFMHIHRLGNLKVFGTRPNWVVFYIACTKFHLPWPVFHLPGQIFTCIGERASASFPAWNIQRNRCFISLCLLLIHIQSWIPMEQQGRHSLAKTKFPTFSQQFLDQSSNFPNW